VLLNKFALSNMGIVCVCVRVREGESRNGLESYIGFVAIFNYASTSPST
jgi:hypothetical protein